MTNPTLTPRTPFLRAVLTRGWTLTSLSAVLLTTIAVASGTAAEKMPPATAEHPAPEVVPAENPLRTADAPTQQQARAEAWTTFQRSCRPCHGNLGAGDGSYAQTFARRASDLRRPSRAIVGDAIRFTRIRDGAASLAERPWESSMPAFGSDLTPQQIWGLVLLLDDFGKEGSGLDPSATGADMYASRCAACHGDAGAGDGPLASELLPPPSNFTQGAYRIRGTAFGEAPLDTDIIGVTAHGIGDTAMGKFLPLGGQRLEDIGEHVRSFTPKLFTTEAKVLPRSVVPTESMAQMAARGRIVYETAGCIECHGKMGRGDGASAPSLKDDAGHPSIATDLTKHWRLKGGTSATDVFRMLQNGMNGTPMKSYESSMSAEDRWAVSYYIERIGRPRPRFAPNVPAQTVSDTPLLDPNAPFWKTIPPTNVSLGAQVEVPPYWTQPSIDAIDLAVAMNGDQLAVLLVWDDPSHDVHSEDSAAATVAAALARHGSWRLPDAVALQFPEKIDPKGALPPLYLGDKTHPVRRWLWSADRQERGESRAEIQQVAGADAAPVAIPDAPPISTAATYTDGQWRLVMVGKRPPKSVAKLALAVQAWDGAAGETGRWQSLSGWLNVELR